jgi:hypothetical protein
MGQGAGRRRKPVRRARQKRITIDPYSLVLFGELYFAKPVRREYERDRKGRFKSKKPNSSAR